MRPTTKAISKFKLQQKVDGTRRRTPEHPKAYKASAAPPFPNSIRLCGTTRVEPEPSRNFETRFLLALSPRASAKEEEPPAATAMEKQSKPAPDALLRALRGHRASLLLASLRQPRTPPPSGRRIPSSSSSAAVVTAFPAPLSRTARSFGWSARSAASLLTPVCLLLASRRVQECCALQSDGILRGEVAAARREAAKHARIAGSELLLVLALAPVVLLLFLLLGFLA